MASSLMEHLHVVAGQPPRAGVPVLATAAVYAAVAGAGLLGAPSLTGVPGRRGVRTAVVLVVLAGYVALLVGAARAGQVTVTTTAAAVALTLLAASTLLLPGQVQALGAAAIGLGQAIVNAEGGVGHALAIGVHLLAAAVWSGGVIHLALVAGTDRSQVRLAVRRFTPYAVASGVLLVLSGWVLLLVHRLGLADLTSSTFGTIVLVKAALLGAAASLGLAHRSGRPWSDLLVRRDLLRLEALVLAAALGFAAVLTGTALPAAAVSDAGPGLVQIDLGGGQQASLFLARITSTAGLLQDIGDLSLRVSDRKAQTVRQVSPDQATEVQLTAGRASLQLTSGLSTRVVTIAAAEPAVAPGVGSPAWLDYQIGRALAIGTTTADPPVTSGCALSGSAVGAALGRAMRRTGVTSVAVVSDGSDATSQLVRGLRQSDVALNRRSPALLVATTVARARWTLQHIDARPGVRAVYLAPWLLDSRLLSLLATLRLPPVLIASTLDAMSPVADRYRAVLAQVADGVGPSIAGLRGFESVAAPALLTRHSLTLYSAAPVGFLPGVLDVGHEHGAPGWFSSGTLVPVSAEVPVRSSACAHPTV